MIDRFADFIQKRPKTIIALIILITALFLIPASRTSVDSSIRLLNPESVVAPLDRLESIRHLPSYEIIVIGKDNESMLSLDALKEQLRIIDSIREQFGVETVSAAEIIDDEMEAKHGISVRDMDDGRELTDAMLDLFEQSPADFEKAAQETLSKEYNVSNIDRFLALQEILEVLPLSLFTPRLEMPHAATATIYVIIPGDRDLKKTSVEIRDSVDSLDLTTVRAVHYSFELIEYDSDQKLTGNTTLMALLTLVLMSALMFLSFRRLYFIFIPFLIVVIALVWTLGTAILLHIRINIFHTFVIALLIGIALDGPIHITKRFLEHKPERKSDIRKLSAKALTSMIPALFLTFITTAGAFVAQIIVPSSPGLLAFALVVIIGVSYSFILVCTLWPAIILTISHRQLPETGRSVLKFFSKIFKIGMKHPKKIVIVLAILLILSLLNMSRIQTEVHPQMFVPQDIPSKEALTIRDTYSPSYGPQFILIEGDVFQPEIISALDRLQENIQDNELFQKVGGKAKFESVNTLLRDANISDTDLRDAYDAVFKDRSIADPVTKLTFADKAGLFIHRTDKGYDTVLAEFWVKMGTTLTAKQSYDDLLDDLQRSGLNEIKGIDISVTGYAFSITKSELIIRRAQIVSSALMLVFTFLVLLMIYRQLRLSLIVSTPILIGSIFSLGLMPLLNINLTSLSAFVIPLIIGLGVDYSIYMAERYREELKRHRPKEAARIALMQTGEGNWLAAATTTVAFAIVSISFLPMARSFGILTSISIALTFLVTLFVLPPLLVKFVKE